MSEGAFPLYLRDIRRTRILDREEEGRLLHRVSEGDTAARDILVVSNLRFVLRIAMRYRNPGLPLADLVNEGCLGLIRAVESFEVGRGVRFLSYAVWWIRASMTRALDRTGSLIRVPGRFAARKSRDREAAENPSAIRWEGDANRLVPFEDGEAHSSHLPGAWDGGGIWSDLIPVNMGIARPAEDAPSALSAGLLARLPEREAQVLRYLYSLDHRPVQSLREVALTLGMSHQRVRQLRDQAFKRLKVYARFLAR